MTLVGFTWDYEQGEWIRPTRRVAGHSCVAGDGRCLNGYCEDRQTVTSVWVAVAVWTKAVAVNVRREVPGGQVQGRMGIFANTGQVETRDVVSAEVVAVCYTQTECERAVADHRAVHGDAAEYKVEEHPVGVQKPVAVQSGPVSSPCVLCQRPVNDGTSYCHPCRLAMFSAAKDTDPGDVEPVRPNTFTPPWDRSGKGSGM